MNEAGVSRNAIDTRKGSSYGKLVKIIVIIIVLFFEHQDSSESTSKRRSFRRDSKSDEDGGRDHNEHIPPLEETRNHKLLGVRCYSHRNGSACQEGFD
jgi:hypothetical protein